jgi:hypothetical protein
MMMRPRRYPLVIDGGMCDSTQSFMYNTLPCHFYTVFSGEMSSLGFQDLTRRLILLFRGSVIASDRLNQV